jgi:hypothetical protein
VTAQQAEWKPAPQRHSIWQIVRHVTSAIPTFAGARDRPIALRVAQAATHDIYHAGQIKYIRALQGV